jgi:hypothetical protein
MWIRFLVSKSLMQLNPEMLETWFKSSIFWLHHNIDFVNFNTSSLNTLRNTLLEKLFDSPGVGNNNRLVGRVSYGSEAFTIIPALTGPGCR